MSQRNVIISKTGCSDLESDQTHFPHSEFNLKFTSFRIPGMFLFGVTFAFLGVILHWLFRVGGLWMFFFVCSCDRDGTGHWQSECPRWDAWTLEAASPLSRVSAAAAFHSSAERASQEALAKVIPWSLDFCSRCGWLFRTNSLHLFWIACELLFLELKHAAFFFFF